MSTRSFRLLCLAVASLLAACASTHRAPAAAAANRIPASDGRIAVMGRHTRDGDAIVFGAAGVTVLTKFRGPAIEIELEEQPSDSSEHDWFTVVVDGGAPTRIRVEPRTRRYVLASGLRAGVHTLALSKATEGQNGHERLVAVYVDALLAADPLPARRIEYIGNSITVGYGADKQPIPCGQGKWYDKSHSWLAYGPTVARRVGAQWMLSAISGIGIVRNWNSPGPVMPRVYDGIYMEYADSLTHWDFARWTPDLVIVALGTNDFSDGAGPTPRPPLDGDAFVRDYAAFVARVRANYPRARLLLTDSPMLGAERKQRQAEYLQRVVDARVSAGDTLVSRFSYAGHFTAGCDGHPDLAEQRTMADQLEPAVRKLMRW
jgi:lysophospholipase L1-like esterase